MRTPFSLILHFFWILILVFALLFKLRCLRLTKILSKEYQVNIKKNIFGSSISVKELMKFHQTIAPKEIKYLLVRLIDAKIWLYTLLIVAVIVFIAANFFWLKGFINSKSVSGNKKALHKNAGLYLLINLSIVILNIAVKLLLAL